MPTQMQPQLALLCRNPNIRKCLAIAAPTCETNRFCDVPFRKRNRRLSRRAAQVERWSLWLRQRYGLETVFVWTPGDNKNPIYPGDDAIAEPILCMCLPHLHPYRGPIAETLGLVWHARTSIFPDSGLMHFAAASPGGVIGLSPG